MSAAPYFLRGLLLGGLLLILVTAGDHARCNEDGCKSDSFPQHRNFSG
jgi:hypothetical protein